jgi:hypothetical protein
MTQHPLYTLRNHVLHTANLCKTPALYDHHIELMFQYHALDCTELDSIYLWEVYAKAARANRKARKALRRYIRNARLYEQHLEKAG